MSFLSRLAIVYVGLIAASAAADSVCGGAVAGVTEAREVSALVRALQPDFVMSPAVENAVRAVYPSLGRDLPNVAHRLILAGAPAATAYRIEEALEIPGHDIALSAQERDVISALARHEGRVLHWNARMRDATAWVLKRGRWNRPLSAHEFDVLGLKLVVGRTDNDDAHALLAVLKRAQGFATTGETIGSETLVTEGQMLAIERQVFEALIAQGGVRMEWDRRLEGVAHYVLEQGRKGDALKGEDFDYLTRALRNGRSNPKMVSALMRVLRGPNL